MKIETYYECPICHSSWPTRNEAITCRNQHPPIEKKWANCEVCGQGWNIGDQNYGDADYEIDFIYCETTEKILSHPEKPCRFKWNCPYYQEGERLF